MGGGFIMIPLMTSRKVLGLTQHQAHATSLFAVATTGLAGAVSYSSLGQENDCNNVDVRVAATVALSGMAMASLGAHASARLSQAFLKRSLGILMLFVAPTIPARDYLLERHQNTTKSKNATIITESEIEDPSFLVSWERYIKALSIGCCSGFLAGVFGVGGGAVVVPALSLFMDMNHYQALGTSLCGTCFALRCVVWFRTHKHKPVHIFEGLTIVSLIFLILFPFLCVCVCVCVCVCTYIFIPSLTKLNPQPWYQPLLLEPLHTCPRARWP